MPRDAQSGFSLIETLVAMAVLAVSATAILSATETHTHTVAAVTDRTVARWVAQNSMVDAQSRRQVPDRVEMGPKAWLVRVDQSATADPTGIFVLRNEPDEVANVVLGRDDLIGAQRMVYVLDLTQPNGMFQARDFVIRDGDTLYVTEAPFTQFTKIVSAITGAAGSASSLSSLASGN